MDNFLARFGRWLRRALGRHFGGDQSLENERPAGIIARDLIERIVGLEIELRGGRFAAMACGAIGSDKGPDSLIELAFERGRRRAYRGDCGEEREGTNRSAPHRGTSNHDMQILLRRR